MLPFPELFRFKRLLFLYNYIIGSYNIESMNIPTLDRIQFVNMQVSSGDIVIYYQNLASYE